MRACRRCNEWLRENVSRRNIICNAWQTIMIQSAKRNARSRFYNVRCNVRYMARISQKQSRFEFKNMRAVIQRVAFN